MTTLTRPRALITRLRRFVGTVAVVCVATAVATIPALADGRPTRAATRSVTRTAGGRTKTKVEPKAKSAKRLTARERTRARSVAAAARTRGADHRVAARATPSAAARLANATAAARAERLRDSVVRMARAQIGVPYVLGGTTPDDGFDCSGLVKYVMAALHVRLPRTAAEQAEAGKRVARDPSRLRPGDLLTFAVKGESVSHIGIYVGNGRMVHASTTAGQVIETALVRPAYPTIKPWRGARRVVAATADAGSTGKQ